MDKLYRPPSLQALQALALVAESSSFNEVADKLHLTQSAVSRKIQQLESHYGAPLLVRNSRNMQLTEHGKAVLEVARKVLRELRILNEQLTRRDRPFRIRIFVSLAVRWLLPRMIDLYMPNVPICHYRSRRSRRRWSKLRESAMPISSTSPKCRTTRHS
jgi:LysR family glycine cleavage system transcriptional activator